MGSGETEYLALAEPVGELLARLGVNLLTGGGGGVMTAVSRAYTRSPHRTSGICIGVLPCVKGNPAACKAGYPNEHVELAIRTHLAYSDELVESRNHINVLSSDALVALPGGKGTKSEVALAVRYGKPIVVFSDDLRLVAEFSEKAPRARTIGEVEESLRRTLGLR